MNIDPSPRPDQPHQSVFADPAVRGVVAALAGLLFGWPMIQIAGEKGTLTLFIYVFVVWALVITVLALIGWKLAHAGTAVNDRTKR